MDQCEDREEGVPPSKTTLCGEDESQSKGQRIHQRLKPEPEQEPSCVSYKSGRSKDQPNNFNSPGSPPSERVEPAGGRFLTPGLRKYSCQLTIDRNTVNRKLKLSEDNRKVTCVMKIQSYPDHPVRFDEPQLLCRTGLTGRCYWEVEWRGGVFISVSYRRIRRKGSSRDCLFGYNDHSWSLRCCDVYGYYVCHNKIKTLLSSSSISNRVSVYVDCPAGILSFYRVSSDSLIHLHTFNTTFTEPLIPGFGFWWFSSGSSVFLR
ncbi:stonustoxin subunit alpha-like [Poecilia reticulata]|uniref:stonustoxin subunit alpha-like n=1 Tax=Poecilia reticulata TaxID=8081 RepID=UPI0007EB3B46|nr:PREDICTED: stonustoxin subunit alpha-like [Poecilia reticulata]XP_017158958.1 PREDICTED: stonustoxin subunit alpha-like [Poecilia reticulata]